jgi:hypothetical protein
MCERILAGGRAFGSDGVILLERRIYALDPRIGTREHLEVIGLAWVICGMSIRVYEAIRRKCSIDVRRVWISQHLIGVMVFLKDNDNVVWNRHGPQVTSKLAHNHLARA